MDARSWFTLALFALTYLALAAGKVPLLRIDRAGIALVGAAAMLGTRMVALDDALSRQCINYEALLLLFGMMVLVGVLRIAGFFERTAAWFLARIRSPRQLLAVSVTLSGLLSAFLVNDIVCIALTPLLLALCRRMGYDPLPHLIAVATAANVGSAATITGNPQNMIIGTESGISYLRFAAKLFPVSLLGLLLTFLLIAWVYRRRLGRVKTVNAAAAEAPRGNVPLQVKAGVLTLLTVLLFFLLPAKYLPVIALCAAAAMLLSRVNPEQVYRQIDWTLLMMFAGLFVVVFAFRENVVEHWHVERWKWLIDRPVDSLSVVSAVLSNLVSNVPAVLLFEPVLRAMPEANQETAWLALAMSSTYAGNLTILGSVANLIVVDIARRDGTETSFVEYCKVGVPLRLLTLLLGVAWLALVPY